MTRTSSFYRHFILLIAAAGVLYPLYFMVTTALKSETDYAGNKLGLPTSATLENVLDVLRNPDLVRWLTNSVIITVSSSTLAIVCALFAAYAIARGASAGTNGILVGLIALMAIPPVVLIVPLFVMMARLGLLNNRLSVILIYAGLLVPLSVFLLVGFLRAIPYGAR